MVPWIPEQAMRRRGGRGVRGPMGTERREARIQCAPRHLHSAFRVGRLPRCEPPRCPTRPPPRGPPPWLAPSRRKTPPPPLRGHDRPAAPSTPRLHHPDRRCALRPLLRLHRRRRHLHRRPHLRGRPGRRQRRLEHVAGLPELVDVVQDEQARPRRELGLLQRAAGRVGAGGGGGRWAGAGEEKRRVLRRRERAAGRRRGQAR
jgi:hypothetical protein